ncbi:MAG: hypothetical protein ACLR6B_02035 [Blautia sp.]
MDANYYHDIMSRISINQWMLCYVVPQRLRLGEIQLYPQDELILACCSDSVLWLMLLLVLTVHEQPETESTCSIMREIDELTGIFNRRASGT